MSSYRTDGWSRREFLSTVALAGSALSGLPSEVEPAEPPPETTRIRLVHARSICRAPQFAAEEFLRAEGFAEVQYVRRPDRVSGQALGSGEADITMQFVGPSILQINESEPIVFLGGVLVGCFELFASKQVRAIRDLKGKTVAAGILGGSAHTFLAGMLAYVGLNPNKEINWDTRPRDEAMQRFAEGKVDAFMGLPPDPQELRAKKIGHVVVNTMMDRPWSQYFCCLATANKEFVRKNPVATKRSLRAILKAADFCARQPERVARFLVDKGYTDRYDYALEALKEMPYKWREYDPEDTVRFFALRMHEIGMIKSSPQKIIAQGTDWRFLRELKKELKT
jgi:NitT/TauT family transport system substrate-binding protein